MTEYVVKFDYSRKNLSEREQRIIMGDFIRLRNEAINIINEYIPKWNDEFEEPEDWDAAASEYEKFIFGKQYAFVKDINSNYKNGFGKSHMYLIATYEGDIIGYSKRYKTTIAPSITTEE